MEGEGKELDLGLETEDIKTDDLDIEDGSGELDDKGGKETELDPEESIDVMRKSIEASFEDLDEKPKSKEKEKETPTLEIGDEQFFSGTEEDLENLVSDPKAFNTMLNNIYKKGVEKAHTLAVENILRSAPDIIKTQIVQQMTLTRAVTKFYDDNKDLVPYKKTVASIANQLAAKYPDAPLPKILAATEQLARKRLQLKKTVENKDEDKGGRFPKKPQGRRPGERSTDDLKGIDKELDEMSKALGM